MTLSTSWSNATGTELDWIGLYRPGANDKEIIEWLYTGGATSGEAEFDANPADGPYEARGFASDAFQIKWGTLKVSGQIVPPEPLPIPEPAPLIVPGNVIKTTALLVNKLSIRDLGIYKNVASLVIPELRAGQIVTVFGESHGDPRQRDRDKQREVAWVTGIFVAGIGDVCRRRGRDLYYAQKDYDCRIDVWKAPTDMTNVKVDYVQRALNKYTGISLFIINIFSLISPNPNTG